jgi:hypothetical protein
LKFLLIDYKNKNYLGGGKSRICCMHFVLFFQDALIINYLGGGSLPLASSLPMSRPSGTLRGDTA